MVARSAVEPSKIRGHGEPQPVSMQDRATISTAVNCETRLTRMAMFFTSVPKTGDCRYCLDCEKSRPDRGQEVVNW